MSDRFDIVVAAAGHNSLIAACETQQLPVLGHARIDVRVGREAGGRADPTYDSANEPRRHRPDERQRNTGALIPAFSLRSNAGYGLRTTESPESPRKSLA